ncbi:hypothetical protein BZL41_21150 [Pseudomonas sp. PIC25]|uniref:DUF1652 domain-containing protein n=1 Tax=Pseudomonas sp. PIC25 TaxID=1958773 RepID=UPI000BAB76C0|nr:DUF1652 domain-containing protein [Pseudomonas sp. PIC25]PAU55274.1 hypothetical protein BZL41_21150 [Pseudomonas sp. PIC25]
MNRLTFAKALELMKLHFHPFGFEATLETPTSLLVRVFDLTTGDTLLTVTGIRCSTAPSLDDVERIIRTVESDLEVILEDRIPRAM